jgi:membrane protease YdiL (CAAX protease family)
MSDVPTPGDNRSRAPSGDIAEQLRGFGPVGLLAVLIILAGNLLVVPLSAVFVLIWARLSNTPWRTLGFAPPQSWTRTFGVGIPFGIVFKLAMKAIVMPLFGAPAINPRYHYVAGNTAALPWILYAVILGAGFGEETVFRGFFFERLGKLLGVGRVALAVTVLLTSGLFALAHYPDQGLPGVQQAAVTGLVFGTIYGVTTRLWLPMVAHAAFDVTAVALIYWNWELPVAHLLFR